MAKPEPSVEKTPLDYLNQADREMAAGNGREAAGLLCKATEATIRGLSTKKGLVGTNLGELAQGLESDGSVEKHHFMSRLVTAKFLREHAANEIMEDFELEGAYDVTRRFVIRWYGEPN